MLSVTVLNQDIVCGNFITGTVEHNVLKYHHWKYNYVCDLLFVTMVPQVFLDFSPHERTVRESRSGEHESPLRGSLAALSYSHAVKNQEKHQALG